jgi:hypothetical protein
VIVTSISGLVRNEVGPARDRERDPDANPDRDVDPDPTRNLNPTPTVAATPAATVTVPAPSGGVDVWFAQCRCLVARLVLNPSAGPARSAQSGPPAELGERSSFGAARRLDGRHDYHDRGAGPCGRRGLVFGPGSPATMSIRRETVRAGALPVVSVDEVGSVVLPDGGRGPLLS